MLTGMLDMLREEGDPLNTPGRAIPDIGCGGGGAVQLGGNSENRKL